MLHTIVRNVIRESIEGEEFVGNVYLSCAADIELGKFDQNFQPIDVRGIIDRSNNRVDNLYGCLKIAQEIEDTLRSGKSPVVYCDGGLERSPLAIAVWFSWMHDVSLDSAYKHVKRHQPGIHRRDSWVKR